MGNGRPGRDASCIFCKIASGDVPCFKVHEDELTLSFMDIRPAADGHTLIITKDHAETLFEAGEEAVAAVAAASGRIARALRETLDPDGLRVYQLNGRAAGQTVFHYHVHLVPCSSRRMLQLHGGRRADPERLRELSRALASALAR